MDASCRGLTQPHKLDKKGLSVTVATQKITDNFGVLLKLDSVLILSGTITSNTLFVARAWWFSLVDRCNFGAIMLISASVYEVNSYPASFSSSQYLDMRSKWSLSFISTSTNHFENITASPKTTTAAHKIAQGTTSANQFQRMR